MKVPTEKDLLAPTFHSDGTVSYWDADRYRWMRRPASQMPAAALEGFTPRERRLFESWSF